MLSNDRHAPNGISRAVLHISLWTLLLAALFFISNRNFLLFHALAELFAVAVGWSVLLLVWNTRAFLRNDALLFLGVAYFFISLLDLTHTLAYRGMNIFTSVTDANPATQLWIAARSLEAGALFAYSLILGRGIPLWTSLCALCGVTALALLSIFAWEVFPVCHVEGLGLTTFKIAAEYAICAVLAASMLNLTRRRDRLEPGIYHLLIMSMALTIMAELTFTLYVDVSGISNVAGHFLNIVSFFLIYLALVRFALKRPYHTLFRQLAQEREALASSEKNGETFCCTRPRSESPSIPRAESSSPTNIFSSSPDGNRKKCLAGTGSKCSSPRTPAKPPAAFSLRPCPAVTAWPIPCTKMRCSIKAARFTPSPGPTC